MFRKLIAIDLDGTLLTRDCTISPRTKKAIIKCMNADHLIVPCSGRGYANTRYVLEDFPVFPYYINANGSTVVEGDSKEPLFAYTLPFETGHEIYKLACEYPTFMEIYHGITAYDDTDGRINMEHSSCSEAYRVQLLKTNTHLDNFDDFFKNKSSINKYHIVCLNEHDQIELKSKIAQIPDIQPITTMPMNIEVTYKRWSKRDGLEWLCKHLDISKENVIAIGDSENDEEVIKWAGTGIAMGNASDQVKALADLVTASNDEDGVAQALEMLKLV